MTIGEKVKEALKKSIQPEPVNGLEMSMENDKPDPRPAIERIIAALILEASKGNVSAAKELREYMVLEREI